VKIVIQALILSFLVHIVYFLGMFLVGYFQTISYKPDIKNAWQSVDYLQNEVAFGVSISPLSYLLSFLGVTFVCGIIIFLYKKLFNKRVR
jgi:quinol-cytochrome oxidoreductase complex cytochrome b subunit